MSCPAGRPIASLVYASSRHSEGEPSWYPPVTAAIATGTAMTSGRLHRRQARARAPGSDSPGAGVSAADNSGPGGPAADGVTGVTGLRGSAATAADGSSGPRSVSHTTIPSRVPAQACEHPRSSHYPGGAGKTAAVHALLISGRAGTAG